MDRAFAIGSAFQRDKDSGTLTVDMAFASEVPYERWWGIEILKVKGARLGRLNDGDGGPVLFNHNWDELRGRHVPGSVRADSDGVLRGKVEVPSSTQLTRDTAALVEAKVLTKASVGYHIHKVVERTTKKSGEKVERELDGRMFERLLREHRMERDGREIGGDVSAFRRALDSAAGSFDRGDEESVVYEVTDWEPLENSFVTVPADNGVGVGRSAESVTTTREVVIKETTTQPVSQPAAPAAIERKTMTVDTQAAAGAIAEQERQALAEMAKLDPLQVEKDRRAAIGQLCKANNIDARIEAKWVAEGTRLEAIAGKILEVIEERGKANPTELSNLGLSKKETNRFSLFKAIRAMRTPTSANVQAAAYEIECSNALAKRLDRADSGSIFVPGEVLQRPLGEAATRAMATTPGASGGYLVNVENMGFIDILRNRSVLMNMGARRLPGLVGNVVLARQTGKATVTWQGGEGTSVTATDQTLGQLSMTPKTAIVITDVSEQLLRQSTPSAEAFVMADLAADIAIDGVDKKGISGAGGAEPLGIKNTTGVTSNQSASTFSYTKALAFPVAAGGANAIRGNPGWVTNIAGAAICMQRARFSNTDTPIWTGNLLDGQLVGFKAMSSEQMASGEILFGSFDEVVIGEWGVLELAMDNGGTRFNQAQVGIRAMWMVDVLVRYPQAFVMGTDLS